MADGVNKAILIGNLGQDPELRYTGSGTAVCNMRVATNKTWTNDAGEEQSRTEWHTVTAWGRMGEVCNEYLEKGSQAYFEGELQTREWEDRDGNDRYSTEVKAHEVQFLGGGGDGTPGGPPPRGKSESSGDGQAQDNPDEKFEPDDELPF